MDKKSFYAFLHQLHDVMRNGQSKFTGMDALNEITNLLTLRLIQDKIGRYNPETDEFIKGEIYEETLENDPPIRHFDINYECHFEWIYWNFCSPEKIEHDSDIAERKKFVFDLGELLCKDKRHYDFVENDRKETVLTLNGKYAYVYERLFKNGVIGDYIYGQNFRFTKFMLSHCYDMRNLVVKIYYMFKDIDFNNFDYDALGEAYEKFKADDVGNSGKRTGQYFTNRQVISYIVHDVIKPKITETFYDPACGTGGFIHMVDVWLRKMLHDGVVTNEQVEVYKKNNIYANEVLPEVFKPLIFNMLIHKINCSDNINITDSITGRHNNKYNKYDVVMTNPPYGMSIDITGTIENYYPIRVKNSTALFLQHIYNILKPNGRAAVIVDRGIINNGTDKKNSWEKKLRKLLLTQTNLYKITLLPKGIFSHTDFATCILFFNKGEQTQNVEFVDAYFDVADKGKSNKKMHIGKSTIIPIKRIIEMGYSLRLEDYLEKKQNQNSDVWVCLGNICKIEIGGTPSTIESSYWNGDNVWVQVAELNNNIITDSSKKITQKGIDCSSVKLVKKGSILMSFKLSIGKLAIAGVDLYCNEAIAFFEGNDQIKTEYLYKYLIFANFDGLLNGSIGMGSLNKTTLNQIKIPLLPLEHQQEIVEVLDEALKDIDISVMMKYMPRDAFNLLIHRDYERFKKIVWYCAKRLPQLYQELEIVEREKKDYTASLFCLIESEKIALGHLVDIKKGTFNTKDIDGIGPYPYYNSGYSNPCNKHSEFSYDGDEYIIFVKDGGNKSNPFSDKSGMAKSFYCSGKSAVIGHNLIFTKKSESILMKYLYFFLENDRQKLQKFATYNSGLGHITMNNIINHPIDVPSFDDQQKIINDIESINDNNSHFKKHLDSVNQAIKNALMIINRFVDDATAKLTKTTQQTDQYKENIENQCVDEPQTEATNQLIKKIIPTSPTEKTNMAKKPIKRMLNSNASVNKNRDTEAANNYIDNPITTITISPTANNINNPPVPIPLPNTINTQTHIDIKPIATKKIIPAKRIVRNNNIQKVS